jgi:hypothetical protein
MGCRHMMASHILPESLLERTINDLRADSRRVSASAGEIYRVLAQGFGSSGGEIPALLSAEQVSLLEVDALIVRE